MKLFKHFTWSEIKEICIKLDKEHCHFRNPKKNFEKVLGKDNVDKLVDIGLLKDSPYIPNCHDWEDPCYEYSTFFKCLSNYATNSLKNWLYYYVFQLWRIKYIKDDIVYKLTNKRPTYYDYCNYGE